MALRCRIVLAAAEGQSDYAIAAGLKTNRKTVMLWRARVEQAGLDGLWEVAPGCGRKATYGQDKDPLDCGRDPAPEAQRDDTLELPTDGHRARSQQVDGQQYSGKVIILKPHRVKKFKLSRDARFLEKLTDVVGLYLNPPQQAMVLCVDEKSQIQAYRIRLLSSHHQPIRQALLVQLLPLANRSRSAARSTETHTRGPHRRARRPTLRHGV